MKSILIQDSLSYEFGLEILVYSLPRITTNFITNPKNDFDAEDGLQLIICCIILCNLLQCMKVQLSEFIYIRYSCYSTAQSNVMLKLYELLL